MSSRKGQIWATDFTAGVVILSFILLFFLLIWNSLAVRWDSSSEYLQMHTDAILASEALMSTSGEPKGWELGNITDSSALGLVNGRNELSEMKIQKLVSENSTSYYLVKERLGVQGYELGIKIMDIEREDVYYEFGKSSGGLDDSVMFERMGILNKTPVIVNVEVWK